MADFELISQAGRALNKCAKPIMPEGVVCVDIPCSLVYEDSLSTTAQTTTGTRSIPGDTVFMLRAFSAVPSQTANCYIRIQFPDGTFLENRLSSFSLDAFFGSFRRSLSKEIACAPGTQITVTIDTTAVGAPAAALTVAITFEGVYRYFLKGGGFIQPTARMMTQSSRYQRSPNTNIMAPELALDLRYLEVPANKRKGPYTLYSAVPLVLGTPGGQGTLIIPVSGAYAFDVRKFLFENVLDNGVTGDVLVRPRDGAGYALTSDYAPIAQLNSAPLAKEWCIKAGGSILLDFLFRNTAGAGNVTLNVAAVGARVYSV
jgi:hypothetical protein